MANKKTALKRAKREAARLAERKAIEEVLSMSEPTGPFVRPSAPPDFSAYMAPTGTDGSTDT